MKILMILCIFLCALFLSGCKSTSSGSINTAALVEAKVMEFLNDGKQSEAEDYIDATLEEIKGSQRLNFINACLTRSRFMTQEALPLFALVENEGAETREGQCARLIRKLDGKNPLNLQMIQLENLVEAHAEDIFIRWMLAVQCRHFNHNKLGAKHYAVLVEKLRPGPVLLHQTYANILDGLERYEESIKHRYQAVELEPKGWTYQGLGSTLTYLGRNKEADDAFQKGIAASDESRFWRSWAWSLYYRKCYDDSIEKCREALKRNNKNYLAWGIWGDCMKVKKDYIAAHKLYSEAYRLNPSAKYILENIKKIERKVERQEARENSWLERLKAE